MKDALHLGLLASLLLISRPVHAIPGEWFRTLCGGLILNTQIQKQLTHLQQKLDEETQTKVAQAVQSILAGADFAEVPLQHQLNAASTGLLRELIIHEEGRVSLVAPEGFFKVGYYPAPSHFQFFHRESAPRHPRETFVGKALLAFHGLAEQIASAATSSENGKFVVSGTEATVTRASRKVTEAAHRHEVEGLKPEEMIIQVSVEAFGVNGTVKGVPGEGEVVPGGILLFMAGPGTGRPALHGSPPAAERFHVLMSLNRE